MAKPLKHQVIAGALQLIVQQKNWTRGTIARSAGGVPCALLDPAAVRFCAIGALNRAAMQLTGKGAQSLARDAEIHVLKANGLATPGFPRSTISRVNAHHRAV